MAVRTGDLDDGAMVLVRGRVRRAVVAVVAIGVAVALAAGPLHLGSSPERASVATGGGPRRAESVAAAGRADVDRVEVGGAVDGLAHEADDTTTTGAARSGAVRRAATTATVPGAGASAPTRTIDGIAGFVDPLIPEIPGWDGVTLPPLPVVPGVVGIVRDDEGRLQQGMCVRSFRSGMPDRSYLTTTVAGVFFIPLAELAPDGADLLDPDSVSQGPPAEVLVWDCTTAMPGLVPQDLYPPLQALVPTIVDVTMPLGAAIVGRVVDGQGRPLTGLCAVLEDWPRVVGEQSATVGPDGRFVLRAFQPGPRHVMTRPQPRCTTFEINVPNLLPPQELARGEIRTVTVVAPARGDEGGVDADFVDEVERHNPSSFETYGAGASAWDPVPSCAPGRLPRTVWRHIPAEGALAYRMIRGFQSAAPTMVVAVFAGDPRIGPVVELHCERVDIYYSDVVFQVPPGQDVWILVGTDAEAAVGIGLDPIYP